MSGTISRVVACAWLVSGMGVAQAASEVNVYSSRHYDSDTEIFSEFTKKTNIKVNVVQIKEATQLIERVKSEGAGSPVDLLITADVGNLWRAQEAGVIQPLEMGVVPPEVPAHFRDPEGNWVAIAMRARVLAFSRKRVKADELPTYQSLAEPKWKGRVLVRSSNHVYNQSLVASMLGQVGVAKTEEWAKGVTANLARKPEGGDTDQIKAIAAGKGDVAIVNTYYYARLAASGKPEEKALVEEVGLVFPDQKQAGSHVNVSGVALARNAPHKADALKLVAYLLTPEVQGKLVSGSFEYPVHKAVEGHPALRDFGSPKFDFASLSTLGKQTPGAIQLMDRAGWR